jgi:hypothetical protein
MLCDMTPMWSIRVVRHLPRQLSIIVPALITIQIQIIRLAVLSKTVAFFICIALNINIVRVCERDTSRGVFFRSLHFKTVL